MSLSGNRFSPLGGASSSNEQDISVPITGTTDQTLRDASHAGPPVQTLSMILSDLRKDGPNDHETLVRCFRKVKAYYAEEEAEKKRLQQSNAARSQLLRKRTASPNEAEEPPKRQRQRKGSDSRSQTAQEVPVTVPTTDPDSEPNDGREPTPASAMVGQEDPYLSPPSSFDWSDLRMPKYPLLCVVQVNNSITIGSLDKDTTNWAFQLSFDAEQGVVPSMTMKFFSNGIRGPQSAQTGWCLGDWIEPDWMVTDFKVHRVADCAEDGLIRHPYVLGQCKTEQDKARMICISLEAWPKLLGHVDRNPQRLNPQPGVKKFFSAVLRGRHPYHLRIWFLAPGKLEDFERRCLSIFTLWFQQRKPPYDGIRDVNGIGFNPWRP